MRRRIATTNNLGQAQPRRSKRKATINQTAESDARAKRRKTAPPRPFSAMARARDPIPGRPTAPINEKRVEQLRKEEQRGQKKRLVLVYAGEKGSDGKYKGTRGSGHRAPRRAFKPITKKLGKILDKELRKRSEQQLLKHKGGEHAAEAAHNRAVHKGGHSDPIAAPPASNVTNTEDIPLEHIQNVLDKEQKAKVSLVETAKIDVDPNSKAPGALVSRRRVFYARPKGGASSPVPFASVLQDGQRLAIDKDEVRGLKGRLAALSPIAASITGQRKKPGKRKKGRGTGTSKAAQVVAAPAPLPAQRGALRIGVGQTEVSALPPEFQHLSHDEPNYDSWSGRFPNDSSRASDLSGSYSPGGSWRGRGKTKAYYEVYSREALKGNKNAYRVASKKVPPSP